LPKFVLIIGPQAVGKMTVGQKLSELTNFKLFYNHMTIELVRLIFDYNDDAFHRMNSIIRKEIFKEYSKSNEKGIIFTGCLNFGPEFDAALKEFNEWTNNYEDIYVVELETTLEERLRRNKTENRLKYKISKRDLEWSENDLLNSVKKHKFNSEIGQLKSIFKNYIRIDNTDILPEDVAKIISQKFNL